MIQSFNTGLRNYVGAVQRLHCNQLKRDSPYDYPVYFANDLFVSQAKEAILSIKKSSQYKHRFKLLVNQLSAEVDAYDRLFNRRLVCPEAFAYASQYVEDMMSDDIRKTREAVNIAFGKNKFKHHDIYAQVELLVMLVIMANRLNDKIQEDYGRSKAGLIRLTKIEQSVFKLAVYCRETYGSTPDMDPGVENGLLIMARKICSHDLVNDAISHAEKEYKANHNTSLK